MLVYTKKAKAQYSLFLAKRKCITDYDSMGINSMNNFKNNV